MDLKNQCGNNGDEGYCGDDRDCEIDDYGSNCFCELLPFEAKDERFEDERQCPREKKQQKNVGNPSDEAACHGEQIPRECDNSKVSENFIFWKLGKGL